MGTTLSNEELREEVEIRENEYKEATRVETWSKFYSVIGTLLPSLIHAIFDPTVRTINLNIVRPNRDTINNNCKERKSGRLDVSTDDIKDKAIYLEELYRW